MAKQNVFELLNFIKRRFQRDQEELSNSQAKQSLNFKQNFNKNAPNLIVPLSSKIYTSKRKTRNSVTQPRRIAQSCSKQNFKDPKMTLQKLQQDLVKWNQENQSKSRKKLKCKAKHKVRKEHMSRSSLSWLSRIAKNLQKEILVLEPEMQALKNKICQMSQSSTKQERKILITTSTQSRD